MSETTPAFREKLQSALDARRLWLERTELPRLKNEFRSFHTGISTLYGLFVKKGYIAEDPYKNDAKTGDLRVPDTGPLLEANKRDQLGQRLSQLDNELDYLVNFYQFSTQNFTQEKIKIMLDLVRYVDWDRLSIDSGPVTHAVADIITNARQAAGDPVSITLLNESISKLDKSAVTIGNSLKVVSDFNREAYKYDIRVYGIKELSAKEATLSAIKKNFSAASPGSTFYPQLAEEVLKEDFSPQSGVLQEKILKKLAVADEKAKVNKQAVNYRAMLIEGLNVLGNAGVTLGEITLKLEENHELMQNRRKSFWEKVVKLMAQMTNKEPEPTIYELEFIDPVKGTPVREKLNYTLFISEIEKKAKILAAIAPRGNAEKKLETMEENQLIELLQKNIKDVSSIHKTLSGLDEYFKQNIDSADRQKIRGIKPELSALKNASTKGGQKFYDYNAQKEEAEQFKKLGITL